MVGCFTKGMKVIECHPMNRFHRPVPKGKACEERFLTHLTPYSISFTSLLTHFCMTDSWLRLIKYLICRPKENVDETIKEIV